CFQAAPMCSPTRNCLYTGQYPVKTGAYPNHTRVNAGVKTIAGYLPELGYKVALSGKSHVGPEDAYNWERLPNTANPNFARVDQYLAARKADASPFCLILCSNEPHTPWDKGDPSRYKPADIKLPPYYVDTSETRKGMSRYLAEITFLDGQVGKALDLLEKHNMVDNTLVIFLSEQGNSLPFAKWTCYDNGLQSAMIARWPGNIASGSVNRAMVEYVDVLPTIIEAAGGKPDAAIDGRSLMPVFAGRQEHKQFVFGEMTSRGIYDGPEYYGSRSVRSEQFKYIWNFTPDVPAKNTCSEKSPEFKSWERLALAGDQKAKTLTSRYRFRPEIELYDVVNDPLEMNDLTGDEKYASVKAQLREQLDLWMSHCNDKGQETEMSALEHMGHTNK
ncbi:MAG: sulfatase, partial [Sedimentisphaerales bacterium]|nr:sulfatase [Sedimentisphaerales bacterium]